MPQNPPIVTLDPWEYDHAHAVGVRRATANWATGDRPSYRNDRKQDERTASAAAAIAELAVAKHFGLYWPGTVWAASDHARYRHLPDVYPSLEVRRVRARRNRAAIRSADTGQGKVLVVAYPVPDEFREVEIVGWLPCDDAWAVGGESAYDSFDSTRVVTAAQLRHADTLLDFLTTRDRPCAG